ncbi:sensor histidine kinase [Opacimonas viscosa]|uniref:histidine kinase n=1 Tax=Opacimonas viscosa TaxID=2961944 RepID=A0AA41WYT3_9ALTE|nr:ATP-binding protein [Opacimonas viscosa]MCP3428825.1 ATP-binding protein [Opacimonas viscosa]
MNSSLRNKLTVGVTFIEAVFLLFLALMVTSIVKEMLNENLSAKAKISANLFAAMTKSAVVTYDIASLDTFVQEIMQQEGMAFAVIKDAQGNLLAQAGNTNKNNISTTEFDIEAKGILVTKADIKVEEQFFGSVEIGINNTSIKSSIQEIQGVIAGIALAEILFVGLVAFIFSGYLIRQLNTLKDSAENVTDQLKLGEPIKERIDIFQTDKEIYAVAESFNTLIDSLNRQIKRSKKFQNELFNLNASLEEQVVNRTAMLKESNYKLKNINKDLKETQSQLSQAEKMASVGQLAAGVAHEINNPVGFVKSNLDTLQDYNQSFQLILKLLLEYLGTRDVFQRKSILNKIEFLIDQEDLDYLMEDSLDILQESSDGLKRVSEIVSGMKAFSRANDESFQIFNINSCINTTLKMVSNQLKYHCEIITELDENIPEIQINVGKMIQVFTNLLVNAGHAISEKGKIVVTTISTPESIEIKISDNGSGIAKEHLEQLFNPFFTTKPEGEGTGLGLSITFNIIEEHGGSINVESEVGVGTCFTIKLPLHMDEPVSHKLEKSPTEQPKDVAFAPMAIASRHKSE